MKRTYALIVVIGLSCAAGIASAANDSVQLSEGEIDQRLQVLERYLDGDLTVDVVEASKSAIGIGYLSLVPLKARLGADPVRNLPDAALAEKRARLQAAEALLERNAERAKDRASWKMYAGNGFSLQVPRVTEWSSTIISGFRPAILDQWF